MSERTPIPVDSPFEPAVRQASTVGLWVRTIGGPVVWIVHFAFVYFVAEAACATERSGSNGFVGSDALVVAIVVATVVAMAGCGALLVTARRADGDRVMARIGEVLGMGAAGATLVTGLAALVVGPC
ncbi:MAG: hypothetical protein HKN44_01420 [Ilumatobacter sp.]|nr:hypothetical protein [Ilumatobacter sp.]